MSQVSAEQPTIGPNAFDFLRLLFAFSVLAIHAHELSRNAAFQGVTAIFNSEVAVQSFFVISGFLILASYHRASNLRTYVLNRIRRLYPAYVAVILVCALLGGLLSSLPIHQYVSLAWVKYLVVNLLFLNFLQPTLPGVFESNPLQAVNGALWTLKIEVAFYMVVPLLALAFRRWPTWWVFSTLYLGSLAYYHAMGLLADHYASPLLAELARQSPGQMAYFVSGAMAYYCFDQLRGQWPRVLVVAALVYAVSAWWGLGVLKPLSLAGLVLSLAFCLPTLNRFGRHGDLSYGVYILHFPVLQAFVHFHWFDRQPFLALAGAIALIFGLAALSWRWIESPFLRRRGRSAATVTGTQEGLPVVADVCRPTLSSRP